MIVNLGTQGRMHISFMHSQVPIKREKLDNEAKPLRIVYGLPYDIRGVTDCLITYSSPTEEVNASGHAFCSYSDNYNKSKGRKISLARALAALDINKQIRTQVWTEYLKIKTGESK